MTSPTPAFWCVLAFVVLSKGLYEALVHRAEIAVAAAVLLLLGPAYLMFQARRQSRRWLGHGAGTRIKPKTAKTEPTPTPEMEPAR